MKHFFTFVILFISINACCQDEILIKYRKAESELRSGNTFESYKIFKDLYSKIKLQDTLHNYNLWYYVNAITDLEYNARMKEDFAKSLDYGTEALKLIQDGKKVFDTTFAKKEPWMIKNIIVSNFGLDKVDQANQFKKILYDSYRQKALPKGIDGFFNFDYFILEDKNIWGYEWYPELPDNRFSSSFTKVVYYVYSRNPDGSDKDQLYRFHVLMFHQDSKDAKFDYILEKQQEINKQNVSGSYYSFVYKKDIDYLKLRQDVKNIISNKLEPDTRRTIQKN